MRLRNLVSAGNCVRQRVHLISLFLWMAGSSSSLVLGDDIARIISSLLGSSVVGKCRLNARPQRFSHLIVGNSCGTRCCSSDRSTLCNRQTERQTNGVNCTKSSVQDNPLSSDLTGSALFPPSLTLSVENKWTS